jgi:hypothetical protein
MAISLTSSSTTGAVKVNGQDVITTDASGNVSLRTDGSIKTPNEFIKSNLNASGDAPIYACRAWVNFNGTGTVAIRGSGNVSSITDNGVGDYTVNFTTAMPDANYSMVGSSGQSGGALTVVTVATTIGGVRVAPTTSSLRIVVSNIGTARDSDDTCLSIFR